MLDYFVAGLTKSGAEATRAAPWCFTVSAIAGCPGTPPSARWRSGFTHVDWYPDGADGWREAGFPLEAAQGRAATAMTRADVPSQSAARTILTISPIRASIACGASQT